MQAMNLDDIVKRLVDSILADNIFKREELEPKIRAILKVWINVAERPVNWDNAKTPIGKIRQSLHKRHYECQFWRKHVMQLVQNKGIMMAYYNMLDKELKELGLENIDDLTK